MRMSRMPVITGSSERRALPSHQCGCSPTLKKVMSHLEGGQQQTMYTYEFFGTQN